MAIACLRLVTFLPDRPERSAPRFISCMLRSTLSPALAPYRRLLLRRVPVLPLRLLPLRLLPLRLLPLRLLPLRLLPLRLLLRPPLPLLLGVLRLLEAPRLLVLRLLFRLRPVFDPPLLRIAMAANLSKPRARALRCRSYSRRPSAAV
jgi:hypothetical protein